MNSLSQKQEYRLRQIQMAKKTVGYINYSAHISKASRNAQFKNSYHPHTPDHMSVCFCVIFCKFD